MSPRTAIQFGQGLSRSPGHLAARPEMMRDLRNVLTQVGKVKARGGLAAQGTLDDGGSHVADAVLAVQPSRVDNSSIIVARNSSTGVIEVWRTDSAGGAPEYLADWFSPGDLAHDPPRIVTAEVGRLVFLAHDEPLIDLRAPTYYYDPDSINYVEQLTADLDLEGDAPVKFAGVVDWSDYLLGWGYGTPSEDRADFVWVSMPGEPTVFDRRRWLPVGSEGDPIAAVVDTPTPLIFKASKTYQMLGRSVQTFGSDPVDREFGVPYSRLAIRWGQRIIGWSLEGPRVWSGPGESENLSLPLDLQAPAPTDLVAEGALEDGFTAYLPDDRVVLFVFGQRVYALSLWAYPQEPPEWSYWELGATVRSAGVLYDSGNNVAPAAAPAFDSLTQDGTELEITIDHPAGVVGDEWLEVWISEDGGDYELRYSGRVNGLDQEVVTASLSSDSVAYDLAFRYRRGSRYNDGAEDPANAGAWPTTSSGSSPIATTAVWSRNSDVQEQIELTINPASRVEDIVIERALYDGATWGAYSTIETIAAASIPAEGDVTYQDVSDDEGLSAPNDEWGEEYYRYRVSQPTATGAPEEEVVCWAGPLPPEDAELAATSEPEDWYKYAVDWTPDAGATLEIYDNYECKTDPRWQVRVSDTPGSGSEEIDVERNSIEAQPDSTFAYSFDVRMYHRETAFTVEDWSPYVRLQPTVDLNGDEDAHNACTVADELPADAPDQEVVT